MPAPLELNNRLIMAPMGTNSGTGDGLSTERGRHHYALRAEGGVAATVAEAAAVSEGVPYTAAGDANLPGDVLSVLRDASMAASATGLPLGRPR